MTVSADTIRELAKQIANRRRIPTWVRRGFQKIYNAGPESPGAIMAAKPPASLSQYNRQQLSEPDELARRRQLAYTRSRQAAAEALARLRDNLKNAAEIQHGTDHDRGGQQK
jgi:hypothetical protein